MKTFKVLFLPILVGLGFFYAISGASASQGYLAEYWDTAAVATPSMPVGAATVTTTVSEINFDWDIGSPAGIGSDGFIARYTKTVTGGNYVFRLGSDDGSRVYIDSTQILGAWVDQSYMTTSTIYTVPEGTHTLKVEYYENAGVAKLAFSYSVLFAGGLGTVESPYQVSTCQELQNISSGAGIYLDKYFELTGDIECAIDTNIGGALYDDGYGFNPIGTLATPFSGNFDGNGYTVTGLNIYRSGTDYVGLFGYVSGSVHDIKMDGTSVVGHNRVGSLIGKLTGGLTAASLINGHVTGTDYVGGLVGGSAGAISAVSANASVYSDSQYIGGLVGGVTGTITNAFSAGHVVSVWDYYTGDFSVGGLVGVLTLTGTINNSSSTANVDGVFAVGGLVGSALGNITNSFALGHVTGTQEYTGGLVGSLSGNVSSSYATGRVYGNAETGGLVGVADSAPSGRGNIYDSHATGVVIGNSYRTGGLVGATNALVSNCYATGEITGYSERTGGLIGGSSGQVVSSTANNRVNGNDRSGGLVGYLYGGQVTNSYFTGPDVIGADYVGGLVGYAERNEGVDSLIESSNADTYVQGSYYIGGLVGYSGSGTTVSSSYSLSDVHGFRNNIGGLIGYAYNNTIFKTYETGNVTSTMEVGTYHFSQKIGNSWVEKYAQNFAVKYNNANLAFAPINNNISLRIEQKKIEFADIDQVQLRACGQVVVPTYARNLTNDTDVASDLAQLDQNVSIAHDQTIEISWDLPETCQEKAVVSIYANEYGPAAPLLFMGSYGMEAEKTYQPFWRPSTGHPDGYTYINITSDTKNVYFALDVTPDNTNDQDQDWVEIEVGNKSFRIDDHNKTWGECTFGLTDKVGYKHQICNFAISKDQLPVDKFNFNLRYYGTAGTSGIGGLIGLLQASTLSQSYASGNVYGESADFGGGLIGRSESNHINDVYATGNVNLSFSYVGGLIGLNSANAPDSINNAYATGKVTGNNDVGGLIGGNNGDDINNSFAVGTVVGTNEGFYEGLVGYDDTNDRTLYTNNFWSNNYDRGINSEFGFEDEVIGRWEKVASPGVFQGDYSVAPFKVGDSQKWDTAIWAFPADDYPKLQAFYGTWQPTCRTIANAATYNTYPVCGVATCNSGYSLTDGACVANSGGGSVTIVLPPGVGDGDGDSSATGLGAILQVGSIDQFGTNVLTYINNNNNFSAPESSNGWNLGTHNFVITNLDLASYIATITFSSNPVTITLKKGESQNIDLDGDKIADIRATFSNTYVNRAEITVKSLALATGSVTARSQTSKIEFLNILATSFQPGAKLKFDYKYPNEGTKSISVKVTRQLVNSSGKVIKTVTVSKLIKPGISFIGYVNENLTKNLVPGNYTINIIVKDKVGKLLDQNSLMITVEKLKKNYFMLSSELPTATDIAFDQAVWNKIKSGALVPTNPKFKFSYTNSTGVKHTVRMVRELIGSDGKVLDKKIGKWQMSVGETESLSFVQAIGTKLTAGDYKLKITASDWTTKAVLAENVAGFAVELR